MGSVAKLKFKEAKQEALLKLDLGAWPGRPTEEGFTPLSKEKTLQRWPYKDNSVDEANCNFLIHLLEISDRINFMNELYRVMKPEAKAQIITPHWCASKAYGDPRVQWPPITEYFYPMLNKAYREAQRDGSLIGLTCNFEHTLGYGLHPFVVTKHQERQQEMVSFNKEAAQDLIATLTKV